MSHKFALKSERVVLPHKIGPATILIDNTRIDSILDHDTPLDVPITDVGRDVIMPGLIDIHVHLNDPGRDWEGFASGTQAAVAGGITTVVDMPLNSSPVTTNLPAWTEKAKAMHNNIWSNCALHAGVTPDSLDQLNTLFDLGCVAGKAFMVDSGIDEFGMADEETLRQAMKILAHRNRPLLAHAELALGDGQIQGDTRQFANYVASRPDAWEVEAIKLLIKLCRETGCAIHVVHLATAAALPDLREARAAGLPITVETCPHYLYFSADQIPDGATAYKCSPPIRSAANKEALWEALFAGDIDLIASDHSPCDPILKQLDTGDFQTAWGGISALQLSLPIMYTELRQRITDEESRLRSLSTWLTQKPAAVLGFTDFGQIQAGMDADLVIWNPEQSFTVKGETLYHRHKLTPYEGKTLYGQVQHTIVNGRFAYQNQTLGEAHGCRIDNHD